MSALVDAPLIYAFTDPLPAGADPRAWLGGKGASLAEMSRAQFRVPPGFTITTDACRWFYAHNQTWPPNLEVQIRAHMKRLEDYAARTFGRGPDRLLVSVRSGAAASMPGMMDTDLNVGAGPDAWAELTACINTVFKSWMSDRAVAYRSKHGFNHDAGTAVNVQSMFPSELSGVAFTLDPNAVEANQVVIEASHGLGEAVVSGEVTPDRFLISRDDFAAVESIQTHETPTLSNQQLKELCELSMRVEKHFGVPVDIEWGWAKGEFALLQSRPIRGLERAQAAASIRRTERERLRVLAGATRKLWVTHNLGETLRFPTPLTWDIVRHFMSGNGGFGLMYRDLGYRPAPEVRDNGFLELIAGRIYADPERAARFFWDGLPMGYDLNALRDNPNALNLAPTKFETERVDGAFLFRFPGLLLAMWRTARELNRLRAECRINFQLTVLPAFLDYVRSKRGQDLQVVPTPGLIKELHDRRARVLNEFGKESLKPGFAGALALGDLEQLLQQFLGRTEGSRLASTLTAALHGDTTFEQDALLSAVARGEKPLSDFVEFFGHRCSGEMELMQPRWREDPAHLQRLVEQIRSSKGKSPEELHAVIAAKQRDAIDNLSVTLEQAGALSLREEVDVALSDARALLAYRESGKHYLMMGYELIREVIIELGRRWSLGDGVFFLKLEELDSFEQRGDALKAEIPKRKLLWEAAQKLSMPDSIDSLELDSLGLPPKISTAQNERELPGTALSAGVGEGIVRIVNDPRDAVTLGSDYILVCPSTDPGWTPLFVHARALIVERGGTLSHGAIVARDFGIPAVCCKNATTFLRDGERVRVDGNSGLVQRLEELT